MNKNSSIIQINGQPYDAVSGKPLEPMSVVRRNLDGIMPGKAGVKAGQVIKPAAAATPKDTLSAAIKKPVMDISRRSNVNLLPKHKPEHAKTLMRSSVPKPGSSLKHHVKAQGEVRLVHGQTTAGVATKLSVAAIDQQREQHAKQIAKSQHISHFNPLSESRSAPHAVQPTAAPAANKTPASQSTVTSARAAKPSLDMFERALSQATAHEQPLLKRPARHKFPLSKRLTGGLVVVVGLLLIGGFITYQNVPNINLHLASSRAGFAASLPGYRPAGFSLGTFNASQGEVVVHFKSNSDQRAFAVSEKASDWDSATLRDSYVANAAGQNYETINSDGNTIYVYGQNNATWVSGGIWYSVQSNGALSTQQLIEIANSL